MKKRKLNVFKVKRRISDCKRRLDNLKKQGFNFSQDIYNDIDFLNKNVLKKSIPHIIWNYKVVLLAIFLIIIIPLVLTLTDEDIIDDRMNIEIDEKFTKTIINESCNITGNISGSNCNITLIRVKIDDDTWMDANIVNISYDNDKFIFKWDFFLNISNLKNGHHIFSFKCVNEKNFSDSSKCILTTQKESEIKPILEILSPINYRLYTGKINISGNISSVTGNIGGVEIKINNGRWFNVDKFTNNEWFFLWDAKKISDGVYNISARCKDNESYSRVKTIQIGVYNKPIIDNSDYNYSLPMGGVFQFYIPVSETLLLEPNNEYEVEGHYRKELRKLLSVYLCNNFEDFCYLFHWVIIELDVINEFDWLNIEMPNQKLVTPPDEEWHSFSINLSITKNAPKKFTCFTIKATYGIPFIMDYQIFSGFRETLYIDIFFYTNV